MDQTQVMVGNFPAHVGAQELHAYLQRSLGIVDRCKVKRIYGNTPPHAFVQFMSAAVARQACLESDRGRLNFHGNELKIDPCTVRAKSKPSDEGMLSFFTSYQVENRCSASAKCLRTSIYLDVNRLIPFQFFSLNLASIFPSFSNQRWGLIRAC